MHANLHYTNSEITHTNLKDMHMGTVMIKLVQCHEFYQRVYTHQCSTNVMYFIVYSLVRLLMFMLSSDRKGRLCMSCILLLLSQITLCTHVCHFETAWG